MAIASSLARRENVEVTWVGHTRGMKLRPIITDPLTLNHMVLPAKIVILKNKENLLQIVLRKNGKDRNRHLSRNLIVLDQLDLIEMCSANRRLHPKTIKENSLTMLLTQCSILKKGTTLQTSQVKVQMQTEVIEILSIVSKRLLKKNLTKQKIRQTLMKRSTEPRNIHSFGLNT